MKRIYLDNNATTRMDERVLAAMTPYFLSHFGNASSVHQVGQRARRAMDDARESLAAALGTDAKALIFTSGGSESNNHAIIGVAELFADRPRHIVTTAIEHDAVRKACFALEAKGVAITYVKSDEFGLIDPDAIREAIKPETILISVMAANNEVGTVQPLAKIVEIAKEHGILVHSDAVQVAGKMPIKIDDWGADLVTFCAHKIHGPKGIGLSYVRPGVELPPLIVGGKHERMRRAGTENVPGIVGFAEAWRLCDEFLNANPTRVSEMRDRLRDQITDEVAGVRVSGRAGACTPNTLHLCVQGIESEAILMNLDMMGVAASSGSACASGSQEPSHVLAAMGIPSEYAMGAVRFSLSRETTVEEIDIATRVFVETIGSLRDTRETWDARAANSP